MVYNLTPDTGSLGVMWEFRAPAIALPLLAGLRDLLGQGVSREAVLCFAHEMFETKVERADYNMTLALQDIDSEIAHLQRAASRRPHT